MEEVENNKSDLVTKRICWSSYTTAELDDFSRLNQDELTKIRLGKFNLKNARGYTDEQLRLDEEYHVQLHKDRAGMLRLKLKRRFVIL